MCEVARILQTVQWFYQEASLKPKLQSNWKQSIGNKISALNNSIELLKKAKDRSKLFGIEIKTAKQVMKRFNLTLEKPHDVMKAIISLKELTRIYEKKLEMHTKRKERRRKNQCFELYRSKFYRKLSGVDIPEHQVDINEIREYWSKMW
ncbi:hypothetical protein TCON_2567 [Astathelohania contejeani]|uniref:Ribosomal protein S15 n=1 Tax=Astathelohania contejeani TaxID=164912 RepID=A0ABQ7HVN0_9MICR|nr:hypothetical protein TCON_2567 [Thelohania contejeani]